MIWEHKLQCNKSLRFCRRGVGVGVEVGEVLVLVLYIYIYIFFLISKKILLKEIGLEY